MGNENEAPSLFNLYSKRDRSLYRYFDNGVLIDHNLLDLIIIGTYAKENDNFLNKFNFNDEDFKIFSEIKDFFKIKKFVTTPHILTDAIHKINQLLGAKKETEVLNYLKDYLTSENFLEIHLEKESLLNNLNLEKFGIADWATSLCHSIRDVDCLICKNRAMAKKGKLKNKLAICFEEELKPFYYTYKKSSLN